MKGNFRKLAVGFGGVVTLAGLFVAVRVLAQQDLGVGELAEAAGAATPDIKIVVARIIRVIFGLLGIVALILVLYAGFLWMTSGGDEDKVTTAKRLLTNAVIGLAIVLSAFGIAQFVISRLLVATGIEGGPAGGGGGRGGVGAGGLPVGAFYVRTISPTGDVAIRNVVVRVLVSEDVDVGSIPGNLTVAKEGTPVDGRITASGRVIEFVPTASCPEPNQDRFCFDADSKFEVRVTTGIRSASGQPLLCTGLASRCSGTFTTGSLVDVAPPTAVTITAPDDGQSVPADSIVPVWVYAADDAGISYVALSASGQSIGQAPADPPVKEFVGSADWDTTGQAGKNFTLSARAFDVDSNSAASEGVDVSVRPAFCFNAVKDGDEVGVDCGGQCGACGGGACADAAGCAGGLCVGGVCVDRPRIDAVSPGSGAVGTFVAITGRFFGSQPGRVMFLGGTDVADDREAALCATSAWSQTEITVVVPAGAVLGPLEVRAASGESDTTADDRGPLLPHFQITEDKHPGICTVSPSRGTPGSSVELQGVDLGNSPGEGGGVFWTLGERQLQSPAPEGSDWTNAIVRARVPRAAVADVVAGMVWVNHGGAESNRKQFAFQPSDYGQAPLISDIAPTAGAPGEYVTLRGASFGSSPGRVVFKLPDDTVAVGNTDFPEGCSDRFWTGSAVTVKVPATYQDGRTPITRAAHGVSVVRNDLAESNAVAFTVNDAPLRPGICLLDPDNGPVDTRVRILGERFGTLQGVVQFMRDRFARLDGSWNDTVISGVRVPAESVTGPVTVVAGGLASNGVPFAVGACDPGNEASCSPGRTCCGDGVCRPDCSAARPAGGFAYRFSTGEIPRIPTVVEDASCNGLTQSPSPWRASMDACVNAEVVVRLSTAMDAGSLMSAVAIVACNAGESLSRGACVTDVALAGVPFVGEWSPPRGGVGGSLLRMSPAAPFDPNTWYRVSIRSAPPLGARSVGGLYLDGDRNGVEGGDYVWYFRTRNRADACSVDHVEVSPSAAVIQEQHGTSDLAAAATAANCNVLQCGAYTWDWSSSFDGAVLGEVPAAPGDQCLRRVTGDEETPPATPAIVTARIPAERQEDTASVVINFLDPELISTWPSCTEACVNAEVGARANTALDPGTVNATTIRAFACMNESCRVFQDPAGVSVLVETLFGAREGVEFVNGFRLIPASGSWQPGTYYRVSVRGGRDGVRSTSGALLTGALDASGDASWVFRTTDNPDACDVATVTVDPPSARVQIVGDVAWYRVRAASRPDSCDPNGQPLTPEQFSWVWSASNQTPRDLPVAISSVDYNGRRDLLPLPGNQWCSVMCLNAGTPAGVSVCGNSRKERGEDCDDGNVAPGDGCSARCVNEGSRGAAVCGDGRLGAGEDCDYGNRCSASGAVCAADADCGAAGGFCAPNGGKQCSNDPLRRCSVAADCGGGECRAVGYAGCSETCVNLGSDAGGSLCGNGGPLGDGEDCDDGNQNSGDGCSALCLNEGSVARPYPVCGNGPPAEDGEDCDDGNTRDGDGCSARCVNEGTPVCTAERDEQCCGNGIVERAESCDDNNLQGGDGCSARCLLEGSSARYGFSFASASYCGDSVRGTGEACEFTPPPPRDSRFDASAVARANLPNFGADDVRERVASVEAATTNRAGVAVTGRATFGLSCSCTTDASCEALVPADHRGGSGVGCGGGSCCYPRPRVITETLLPRPAPDGVCRNTLIRAEFDQVMDHASFTGNVLLVEDRTYLGVARCPAGRDTFLGSDWCVAGVTGTVQARDAGSRTVIDFVPQRPLEPDRRYGLLIAGDRDSRDNEPAGVRAASGVAMAHYVLWEMFTGRDICSLDAVRATWGTSAETRRTSWLFSTSVDAPGDNAPGLSFDTIADRDKAATAAAYSTRAGGRLEPISPTDAYQWDWTWSVPARQAENRLAPLRPSGASAWVETTASPQSGTATITALARVTRNDILGVACDPAGDVLRQCGSGRSCADFPGAGGRCVGESKSDSLLANVLLCENPWPARDPATGAWEPYRDERTNVSFYYCRDAENPDSFADDLPRPRTVCSTNPAQQCALDRECPADGRCVAVSVQHPEGGAAFVSDLLLSMDCRTPDHDSNLCIEGDGFGIRVLPNPGHLSPARWYATQNFGGRPTPRTVDGYDAVQDGRTVYVHAANRSGTSLFTNIYVASWNEGGSEAVQNIFEQALRHLTLNADLATENAGSCSLLRCSAHGDVACRVDADCPDPDDDGETCSIVQNCSSDLDCRSSAYADDVCRAPQDKLRRDVRRFQDFREVEAALERAYTTSQHCSVSEDRVCITNANCPVGEVCVGAYPDLSAGSFLRGRSASPWPSWQATLGNALQSALPEDPLNRYFDCPTGADAATCWNAARGVYQCPLGSEVYQYEKSGDGYALASDFEFKLCQGNGVACAGDADCAAADGFHGPCVNESIWTGTLQPTSHNDPGGPGITNRWLRGGSCTGREIGLGQVCGDGVVGPGEECEGMDSRVVSCDAGGGRRGFARDICTGATCRFAAGRCEAGTCGDGVVQPPEVCDDGAANGSYGRCRRDCTAIGDRCGDGRVQDGLERCDQGGYCSLDPDRRCNEEDTNGDGVLDSPSCGPGQGQCIGATIYAARQDLSCRFDCRAFGPYCGDGAVQPPETCDGGSETRACVPDPSGRAREQRRTCVDSCAGFGVWSVCAPVGSCGDGRRDAGEVCDDGNRNDNDACRNNCQANVCGDGVVNAGAESCDDGARNLRPDDAAGIQAVRDACPYGRDCNWCTTSCVRQTVGGGSCGDSVLQSRYEVCEVSVPVASWARFCRGTNQVCTDNSQCPGSECYLYPTSPPRAAYEASVCSADCSGACPPNYQSVGINFKETIGGSDRFTRTLTLRTGDRDRALRIPACRAEASQRTVTMDFTLPDPPPITAVFVVDLSQGMERSLPAVQDALKTAIGGLFDNYADVKVGVVSFSSANESALIPEPWFRPHSSTPCRPRDGACVHDQKYAGRSACVEGTDSNACLASDDPAALYGREDRAIVFRVVDQLVVHNTDYGAMGFRRAKDILDQVRGGAKMVIYLSDGESKCGDPGRFPDDDADPRCYRNSYIDPATGQNVVRTVTEPLATKAADDLKVDPNVKIYAVTYNNRRLLSEMQKRSSDCTARRPLVWDLSARAWSVDQRDCTPAGYALTASDDNIAAVYTSIVNSVRTFQVRVGGKPTDNLTQGSGLPVRLPNTFRCALDRSQDFSFEVTAYSGVSVRASNPTFAMCQP